MEERTRYTYGKKDKLKSRKQIAALFSEGKAVTVFPVKCIWIFVPKTEGGFNMQCGVTVHKRNFPKAVDRNTIKRHLRESWRLQKPQLQVQLQDLQGDLSLFLIYTAKEKDVIDMTGKAVGKVINKLGEMLCAK